MWLRAEPEDHFRRVMEQGDLRPMKNRPGAMAELRALLAARSPRYAQAHLIVETSALGLDGAVDALCRAASAVSPTAGRRATEDDTPAMDQT